MKNWIVSCLFLCTFSSVPVHGQGLLGDLLGSGGAGGLVSGVGEVLDAGTSALGDLGGGLVNIGNDVTDYHQIDLGIVHGGVSLGGPDGLVGGGVALDGVGGTSFGVLGPSNLVTLGVNLDGGRTPPTGNPPPGQPPIIIVHTGTGGGGGGGGGGSSGGGIAVPNNGQLCGTAAADQLMRLFQASRTNGWSRARQVQLVPLRVCAQTRGALANRLVTDGRYHQLVSAVAGNASIRGALGRYEPGHVLGVVEQGQVLTVYVF